MVVETKCYIAPRDIKYIYFTCSYCHSVTAVLVDGGREKPEEAAFHCGVCGREWLNGKSGPLSALAGLVKGLREFSREDKNGFTLSFQIDKPFDPQV